jgi:gluconolactonase
MAQENYAILDERFRRLIRVSAKVEHLYDRCRWAEGPAWFPAHRCLIWSDIPNNRMLRYCEETGAVSVFRRPSNYSNGNTVDRLGRLVTCEHGGRRLTRTEHDGSITVIADRINGRRFNSPNDVVVKSDGSIWFTDPTYGIDTNYEGHQAESELDGCHVYRVDPSTGGVSCVANDFIRPNGLAFSPDEKRLYVADTGATHETAGPRHIRQFMVGPNGSLSGGDVFVSTSSGLFDGFRLDESGRVWTSAIDGVHCYEPDGQLIGKILIPEPVANLVFGGEKRNRLFICASASLYSVFVAVNGARTF